MERGGHEYGRRSRLSGQGKKVEIDGMSFFRFKDGKIVEEWSTYDNLTIMKQLGLMGEK
ncbi:ester cyclase [Sphingomonas daechungensis]|uniref:Ester cyclase n=1 Tax=Sphingomonas daechungensis TaxID=1176646 RepID=A0ABX6T6G0_9SPHN|nr:ester cyclase [Sphingomonas daechungensis]